MYRIDTSRDIDDIMSYPPEYNLSKMSPVCRSVYSCKLMHNTNVLNQAYQHHNFKVFDRTAFSCVYTLVSIVGYLITNTKGLYGNLYGKRNNCPSTISFGYLTNCLITILQMMNQFSQLLGCGLCTLTPRSRNG